MADTTTQPTVPGFSDALRFTNTSALGINPGNANMNAQQQQNFLNAINTAKNPNPATIGYSNPTTTPVITAQTAQDDYAQKKFQFDQLRQQQSQQAANLAAKAQADQQSKSEADRIAFEQKQQQQAADQKQQEIDAKNAALGIVTTQPQKNQNIQQNQPTPNTQPTTQSTTPTNGGIQQPQAPQDVTQNAISGAVNTYLSGQQEIQSQKDQLTSQMSSQLTSLMQGTIPLTQPQQALIASVTNQLNINQQAQQIANQAYVGQVTEAAFRQGGEYTNQQMSGQIANAISYGTSKIQALDAEATKTIASLEMQFQQQNFDNINKQYDILTKQLDDKASYLQKMYDSVTSQLSAQRNYNLQLAQFQETQYKDATQLAQANLEFRDAKDAFGNTVGTEIYDKTTGHLLSSTGNRNTDGSYNPMPIVSTSADGTPDKSTQQAFLQTIPPQFRDMVVGIASGKIEAPSARTKTGMQMLSWVAQYDPTLSDGTGGFDATKYQARSTFAKSLASNTQGSYGGAVMSANKMINHLVSFTSSVQSLGNQTISPLINAGLSLISTPLSGLTGGDRQTTLNTAQTESNGLKDEMAKFFKGTGATDVKSIEDWGNTLDVNATPKGLQGTVQGALNLFAGQFNTFLSQYKSVMGEDAPAGKLLQPETVQKLSQLKNAGYTVDVPGIPYTDKDAYLSHGGTQEDLNKAYNSLKSAGIPTTPENILQAAQL